MTAILRVVSAGASNDVQSFHSGECDFLTMDWTLRFSGENISASGVSAFINWYFPAGFTGFLSGTGVGASSMWVKVSATAPPNANSAYVWSARALTTSAKSLFETFMVRVHTGLS
jgi:hypothetical protein